MQSSTVGTSDEQSFILNTSLLLLLVLCFVLLVIRQKQNKKSQQSNSDLPHNKAAEHRITEAKPASDSGAIKPAYANQSVRLKYADIIPRGASIGQNGTPTNYIYSKKPYLMTKYERYFYCRLHHIFGKYYLIFPQIHLNDLFEHTGYGQSPKGALSKIQRKSADYVICTTDFKILLAIELDDYTHRDPARQQRDRFVEYIFHQAEVQLVRFTEADKITDEEIYKTIMQAVHRSAEVEASYK